MLRDFSLLGSVKLRLITNGSLLHRADVKAGIARIGAVDGEVWFKVDRASSDGILAVNGARLAPERVIAALRECAELAPTWVQTCYFAIDGKEASAAEQAAYLELIGTVREKIKGVHLYGLARPSLQAGAERLSNVMEDSFLRFAARLSALGVEVIASR